MAKRRKRSSAGLVLGAVAILAGIAAAAMLFLPAVAVKDSETTYTGLQIAFGYSEKLPVIGEVEIFKFSFMNLLTYILAVALLLVVLTYEKSTVIFVPEEMSQERLRDTIAPFFLSFTIHCALSASMRIPFASVPSALFRPHSNKVC